MAEIIKNDKNFLIIKINEEEGNKLRFGMFPNSNDNIFICGSCNAICNDNMYYIAAINEILCEACMNDFIKNMNHYTDITSLRYEIKHFNYCANILNIKTIADINSDGELILKHESETDNNSL